MMKNNCSQNYNRAQQMVLHDKFNYTQGDFYRELTQLAHKYMVYDAMTVEAFEGGKNNMTIVISVKKIKPNRRPLA